MHTPCVAAFCVLLTVPAATLGGSRQHDPRSASAQFTIDAQLVMVNVAVRDSRNHSIGGLKEESFRVFEDNREQRIAFFAQDDAPVSVGVVFDASGSMSGTIGTAREAVRRFCDSAAEGDEFFLIQVRDRPERRGDFSPDCNTIAGQLLSTNAQGYTALLDGIYLGIQQLRHASNIRKALLVISDGLDNASRYRPRDLQRLAEESDAQIFCIEMNSDYALHEPDMQRIDGPGILEAISAWTGGLWVRIPSGKKLSEAAAEAGAALHNEYVLGYRPQPDADGRRHSIRVKVLPQLGLPPLRLSYRSGYYAPRR